MLGFVVFVVLQYIVIFLVGQIVSAFSVDWYEHCMASDFPMVDMLTVDQQKGD